MINIPKKLINLLNEKLSKFSLLILFLILFTMIIEIFSIGLIFPLVSLFHDTTILEQYPLITKYLIYFSPLNFLDLGQHSNNTNAIVGAFFIFFLLFFFKTIYMVFFYIMKNNFLYKLQYYLTEKFVNGYFKFPYSFFNKKDYSTLTRNMVYEISTLVASIDFVILLATEILVMIGIISLLIYFQPLITISICFIFGITSFYFYFFTKKKLYQIGEDRKNFEERRLNFMNQLLGGIKEVKVYNSKDEFIKSFVHTSSKVFFSAKWFGIIGTLPKIILELIAVLCLTFMVVLLLGFNQPQAQVISMLAVYAAAAFRLLPSVNRILGSIQKIRYYLPVIENLDKENRLIENQENEQKVQKYDFGKSITLENIEFFYEGSNQKILDGINLNINKFSCTGFIGKTGSGKSTLANILIGLLNPTNGKIKIDGIETKEKSISLANSIGFVPQNIFILNDTIMKNIAFGVKEKEINESKVKQAIKNSKLENLVKNLPKGINAQLGERGTSLSGGQIQRIGIARALYRDPEILVLDEATSSLDNKTEEEFMNVVKDMSKKITIIIITHHIKLLKFCNSIYEINNGKLRSINV